MKSRNGSNNSNNNPSFCLEVWGTDYNNKINDTCILAEKLGYDGFYYGVQDPFDHKVLDLFTEAAVTT